MDVTAAIIARGGSMRLPRKNVKPMCGIPLVAWSVIQAKHSKRIDHVVVSTDDDEIEQIAIDYGADLVLRRPDWPDADQVAANRVYVHMYESLKAMGLLTPRWVTMFPTSPLRTPDILDRCIERHDKTGFHVYPCARNRETIIMRDVLGIKATMALWDKTWSYMVGNSGMGNVCNTEWYMWHTRQLTEMVGDHDKILDELAQDATIGTAANPDSDTYYVECEPWQCIETDTLSEFEFAEVCMDHYILQGRPWEDVYGVYLRGS